LKRSRSIRLVLIGSLSAAAVTSCGPGSGSHPPLSAENVYTNNFYVPGVGYYHAPFRAWYSFPYNHFDPQTQRYFYGGQWSQTACQTITNISSPLAQVAAHAEAQRTDIQRGGFGSSAGFYAVHS
jgi:hypothetical protein